MCRRPAVDGTTVDYLKGRPFAPSGAEWDVAVDAWATLHSDPDAVFDRVVEIDAADIDAQVTWGTSPEMVVPVGGRTPDPSAESDPVKRDAIERDAIERALAYMGLERSRRSRRSPSTRSLSAPAPIRASKTSAPRQGLSRDAPSRPTSSWRSSYPDRGW